MEAKDGETYSQAKSSLVNYFNSTRPKLEASNTETERADANNNAEPSKELNSTMQPSSEDQEPLDEFREIFKKIDITFEKHHTQLLLACQSLDSKLTATRLALSSDFNQNYVPSSSATPTESIPITANCNELTTNLVNAPTRTESHTEIAKPDCQIDSNLEAKNWKWENPTTEKEQENLSVTKSEEIAQTQPTTNEQNLNLTVENSRDLLKIMTEWDPEWMFTNEHNNNENDSQILSKSEYTLRVLPQQFASLKENKSSFVPLMLHELWSSIYRSYEEKRKKDLVELVPGLIRMYIPKDDRFTSFYFNAAICPSEKEGDIAKRDSFVSVRFPDKTKGTHTIVFGFIAEIIMPYDNMYTWCQNLVKNKRHNDNATIPMRYLILTKKLTPTQIINLGLAGNNVSVTVNFLSSMGPDLSKAEALINLSKTSLSRSLIQPTAETLSFPKLPGILHPDIRDLYAFSKLNKIQREVVVGVSEACLKNPVQNKVCLVQGPPGTGKSSTICGILLQILATHGLQDNSDRRPRCLVCAPSNAAVDSVCLKLIAIKEAYPELKSLKFARFGVPEKTHPAVQKYCFQTASGAQHASDMQEKLNEVKTLVEEAASTKKEGVDAKEKGDAEQRSKLEAEYEHKIMQMQTIRSCYNGESMAAKKTLMVDADIILTTLSSSHHPAMQELFQGSHVSRKISVCIIDEAGQCVEPEALIPLQYNMTKLVMVGDHKQLPATVISRTAKDHRYDASLFKRLFTSAEQFTTEAAQNSGVMLTTQYRMHPSIAAWPNQFFYSGLIQQGINHPEMNLAPYTFIDSNSSQTVLNAAICNEGEVSLVKEAITTVKQILGEETSLSIGVITFYRWQKEKLTLMAEGQGFKEVEVNTVDGFQGAEKDVIIISCVRSGNSIGFLEEGERLNVALTRAKRALIVIGNITTFQRNSMWNQLIKDARARNVVFVGGTQSMKSILTRSARS